jgi:hypothetical protein
MVTSPNVTLTLAAVPVRMAGAAGGALQTAQRIGAAIGTALLASLFYRVLTGSGHAYPVAVSDALLGASALMLLALLLAIAELWQRHRHHRDQPTPHPTTPTPHPRRGDSRRRQRPRPHRPRGDATADRPLRRHRTRPCPQDRSCWVGASPRAPRPWTAARAHPGQPPARSRRSPSHPRPIASTAATAAMAAEQVVEVAMLDAFQECAEFHVAEQ